MNVEQFLKEVEEELGIEETVLERGTVLKELEYWDSIAILSMIAYIDSSFGKLFKSSEFNNLVTIDDLIKLIGLEYFSD